MPIDPQDSIPVQIDSIKRLEGFERTRCLFYRVESDCVAAGLPSGLYLNDSARFSPLESCFVLRGPSDGLFTSAGLIEDTLSAIEKDEALTLEIGYLWLPNFLLGIKDEGCAVRKGDLIRLSTRLFQKCYAFSGESISEEEWLSACKDLSRDLNFSPDETNAFRQWRRELIEWSRERYHAPDYKSQRLQVKGKI